MMLLSSHHSLTVSLLVVLVFHYYQLLCHGSCGDNNNNSADWEDLLLTLPDPDSLKSHLWNLTQTSHVAGTPGDYQDAQYVYDTFQSYLGEYEGVEITMEEIPTMLSYPQQHQPARLFTPTYTAKLSEDILPQDTTSGSTWWRNLTFLAYTPAGTVTAPLVYANYGRPQDFDVLEQLGIPVQGALVLMRYGACFRGLKLMNAEQRGALGSILYSDPQQDGYGQQPGSTYPDGPWRPPSSVQRGSAQFISKCAGDPWRLYSKNDSSLSVEVICGYNTSELIPARPALLISYEDALPLLERLGGPIAPDDFQGGLENLTYRLGPSSELVTLTTYNQNTPQRIPNVYAKIPGTDEENDDTTDSRGSIVLGNHRDAWAFGAVDPNSGTTALLEVARVLGLLLKRGDWKPKRTLYLTSWSGEEFGLIGSTAFTELHPEIMNTAIAYLNVDCAVVGRDVLRIAATHSLRRLIVETTAKIPLPPQQQTANDSANPNRQNLSLLDRLYSIDTHTIDTLGSGSDYTAFLDRFGVMSLDMTYRTAHSSTYGVYHSVYDSYSYVTTQIDPTFAYHKAVTQLWLLLSFRLSCEQVLPIYMTDQALYMQEQVDQLAQEATQQSVDMTPLVAAVEAFREAALTIDQEHDDYQSSMDAFVENDQNLLEQTSLLRGNPTVPERHRRPQKEKQQQEDFMNYRLGYTERRFLTPEGLSRRPYFRHVLQAPGFYLGYGSQTFPGIAQALSDQDASTAQLEVIKAATAVDRAAQFLRVGGAMEESMEWNTENNMLL